MKPMRLHGVCLWLVITFISTIGRGQLLIDATGPVHERQRVADASSGGGVGKKLPLLITVQSGGGGAIDANGKTELEIVITNTGKVDLTLPISPHAGDLEPFDPKAGYTVRCLSLSVSHARVPGILPGGTVLYGRPEVPGTLVTVTPGDSIRVLTRVALPPQSTIASETVLLVAGASLNNELLEVVGGKRISQLHEIGSAFSREFTIQSLFYPPK